MSSIIASLVSTAVSASASASATPTSRPPAQAGIIEGANPVEYNPSAPINLFIIQAIIVIVLCQILVYPLRYLQQPRVIAEVIGGIILGPSVMMRIPGFKDNIFPKESMPVFNNVANLGLIIFLFLVALDILFARNIKAAISVSFAGMALPFGLGIALASGIYRQFPAQNDISFGVFGLFVGTALAITAFPVLCRILSELNLLSTHVGVTTLAAGIGNDVVGWVLLALCVALVNNTSGLAALWVLLCAVAWCLFLVYAVRPCFVWCLRRTGSLRNGPTQGMVALTIILALLSSWFTAIVGVHAIFGAFLVGLICPHDGGFAIKLTEKLEDFISVIFLPLYFALSGLNTDLGLLNDAITWGYVVAITLTAFFGKIIAATLAARACRLLWRESLSIGVLMSCKGLVELIVLNIGLQANILTQKTFTMFVVMALVTTVSTTPLAKLFYPLWYQKKVDAWRKGEIDWDGKPLTGPEAAANNSHGGSFKPRRLLVYLRLDSLPGLFTFVSLLGNEQDRDGDAATATSTSTSASPDGSKPQTHDLGRLVRPPTRKRHLEVHGVRLVELTDRMSSVMRVAVTETEELYSQRDAALNAFRTFSRLNDVAVAGRVAVVPTESYAKTLMDQASAISSDFVLIPWSEYGSLTEDQSIPSLDANPERFASGMQLGFVQKAFQAAPATCTVGILINNGFGGSTTAPGALEGPVSATALKRHASAWSTVSVHEVPQMPIANKSHRIFVPYLGGVDDRVALHFVLQLARNPLVTVTVAHFICLSDHDDRPSSSSAARSPPASPKSTPLDTQVRFVEHKMASSKDTALVSTLRASLPPGLRDRVTVTEVTSSRAAAAEDALRRATDALPKAENAGDLVVVGRRHALLDAAHESGVAAAAAAASDLKRTLGTVGERFALAGIQASILVIQAGGSALEL